MDFIDVIQLFLALILLLMVGGLCLTVHRADLAFREQYRKQKKGGK